MTIDDIVQASLHSFYSDIIEQPWHRRERELVSLYAIGHLLEFCGRSEFFKDRTQVGIEVAVPQHVASRRRKPDVCKDIVIWKAPRMSCWGVSGEERHYPLAVMEWKSLNRIDNAVASRRKLREHNEDLVWLQGASQLADNLTGYGVLVTQNSGMPSLHCARVFGGEITEKWFFRPDN